MEADRIEAANRQGKASNVWLGLGLAAGMAALAWATLRSSAPPARRYGDRGIERRNPLHLFVAGNHPRRRRIDRSGGHPLFERRQSVYETY